MKKRHYSSEGGRRGWVGVEEKGVQILQENFPSYYPVTIAAAEAGGGGGMVIQDLVLYKYVDF